MEAMGCAAVVVSSEHEFLRAIAAWNQTEPLFIECHFSAEAYASMTNELR
jgi:hypothetical protein